MPEGGRAKLRREWEARSWMPPLPVRAFLHPIQQEVHSGGLKKSGNFAAKRYFRCMARHGTILFIDENPARLWSAVTILVFSGYSVIPFDCVELRAALERGSQDWQVDLVLIRAVLDAETESLFAQQMRCVRVRRLSHATTLDINLPAIVDETLARSLQPLATDALHSK